MFRKTLEAMSDHWEITSACLAGLIILSIIGGVTCSSLASDAAKIVCFAHHSPVECDPGLRVKTAEEIGRLNESYLRCLKEQAGSSMLCQTLYEH
jgi:hypothetical protein